MDANLNVLNSVIVIANIIIIKKKKRKRERRSVEQDISRLHTTMPWLCLI